MKSYKLALFVFVLGLLINVNSVNVASAEEATASPCQFSRTLTLKSVGPDVACLQNGLGLTADGKLGRNTYNAIINFQREHKINPDGRVGPKSWSVLFDNGDGVNDSVVVRPPFRTISITGVNGPKSLALNESGTWTVNVSDRTGGNLSYSVVWGDEPLMSVTNLPTAPRSQQTATFTHTYSQAGKYIPTFTVTNSANQSATSSLSVNVGNTIDDGFITVLYPNGGETFTQGANNIIRWSGINPVEILLNKLDGTTLGYIYSYKTPTGTSNMVYWDARKVSSDGEFTGGPNTDVPVGQYKILIRSVAGGVHDLSDASFNIVSGTTNQAPTITSLLRAGCTKNTGFSWVDGEPCSVPRTSAQIGETVSLFGENFGSQNKILTYSSTTGQLVVIPVGYVSSNLINFVVPLSMGAGSHGIKIDAIDSYSNIVSLNITSGTTNPVITTTSPLPTGKVGTQYKAYVYTSDGFGHYNWTVSSGSLPSGLSFASSDDCGVLSNLSNVSNCTLILGTPTAAGTYKFGLNANSSTQSAAKEFTLKVEPGVSQYPTVNITASSSNVQIGQPVTLYWTSSNANYCSAFWNNGSSAVAGSKVVYPTMATSYAIVCKNSSGQSATASVNVYVSTNPSNLSITTSDLSSAKVGTNYIATVNATGGTGPYSWKVSSGALPAGMVLNSGIYASNCAAGYECKSPATISGIPTSAGVSEFSLTVTAGAQSTVKYFKLEILPTGTKTPTINYLSVPSAKIGDTVYVYGIDFDSDAKIIFKTDSHAATRTLVSATYFSANKLSFVVPAKRDIDGNIIDTTPGSYVIQVWNQAGNTMSDVYNFNVAPSATTPPPSISGISGPQTLNVNQPGTWTVMASSQTMGNLSYSVVWGDEPVVICQGGGYPCTTAPVVVQQSGTFTHTYAQAGTYSPKFTVTDSTGKSVSSSLSVSVYGEIIVTPKYPKYY